MSEKWEPHPWVFAWLIVNGTLNVLDWFGIRPEWAHFVQIVLVPLTTVALFLMGRWVFHSGCLWLKSIRAKRA